MGRYERTEMLRHINRRMTSPSSVGYLLLLARREDGPCTRHPCHSFRAVTDAGKPSVNGPPAPTCTEPSQLRAAGNERAGMAGQYAEAMQALVETCQGVAAVERTKCFYRAPAGDAHWGCHAAGDRLSCVCWEARVCCLSCNLPPSGLSSSQSHVCWAWLLSASPREKNLPGLCRNNTRVQSDCAASHDSGIAPSRLQELRV